MRSDRSYGSECEYFTHDSLGRVRQMVERAGYRVGFGMPLIDNLVAAVRTIAADTAGRGSITVAACPDGVYVMISDETSIAYADRVDPLACTDAIGRLTSSSTRRIGRQMTASRSPLGITVRLAMPLGAVAGQA